METVINTDGQALYFGEMLNQEENRLYFDALMQSIEWKNEHIIMFGKEITTKRKVAFYADAQIEYTYSKKTKKGIPWIPILLKIKQRIEAATNTNYNACLLNLYHDGEEGMGWHSDDEKEIVPNSSIASLSLGANRKFIFKHKMTQTLVPILLENGSLLEMKGALQKHWWHALPKSKKITTPRINLTFRQMVVAQ